MTAFLFIPARDEPRSARRVDFANIASLFVEVEETPQARASRRLLRIAAALVIVFVAIGDMLFVARPDALTSMSSIGPGTMTGSIRTTSL